MHILFVICDFNPRFPRGKRHLQPGKEIVIRVFQSTLPAREATYEYVNHQMELPISIHASRGGSDLNQDADSSDDAISIHASRGGSDSPMTARSTLAIIFQSTLPAGEATEHSNNEVAYFVISIHASRGGSDVRLIHQAAQAGGFQSTLPAGEATLGGRGDCPGNEISIHASRGGSDSLIATHWQAAQGFQSTLPAGEATPWQWLLLQ